MTKIVERYYEITSYPNGKKYRHYIEYGYDYLSRCTKKCRNVHSKSYDELSDTETIVYNTKSSIIKKDDGLYSECAVCKRIIKDNVAGIVMGSPELFENELYKKI